jgi:hypothetical protein
LQPPGSVSARVLCTEPPASSAPVIIDTSAGSTGAASQSGPEWDSSPDALDAAADAAFRITDDNANADDAGINNSGVMAPVAHSRSLVGGKKKSDRNNGEPEPHIVSRHQQEEDAVLLAIERDVLDLFSDSYCNRHLVFAIIEAVLVRIIPELTDHAVADLMAERGL